MSTPTSRLTLARVRSSLAGPLITLATAAVVELLKQFQVVIPNPGVPLTLTIVLSFLVGGRGSGILSALLAWLYNAYHYSLPGQPFHYTEENLRRMIISAAAIPALLAMLGFLKRRADRTAALVANEARLEAQLAEQKRSEETLRQAERALRDSQHMLETVLNRIPHGVFWKGRDSRYLGCNEWVLRILELNDASELIGKTDYDLPSATREQADFYVQKDREVLESGTAQLSFIEPFTRPDGSILWLETSKMPLCDPQGQVIGVLGTCQDVTERKLREDERQAGRLRLQSMSRRLLDAQESERRRLARELHDEIGQVLTAVAICLQSVKDSAGREGVAAIEDGLSIVDRAIQQVRDLSLDLRPSMLDDLGLEAALRWHLDRQAQRAGFAAQFVSEIGGRRLPTEIETTCFRVAQEALTNVVRYAGAKSVRVHLRENDGEIQVIVEDDGVGFDVSATTERAMRGGSFGLIGMSERVKLVGGRIEIDSVPGRGTRISAAFSDLSTPP